MKIKNILIIGLLFQMLSIVSSSQDLRTMETRIADLLARLPVSDVRLNDKLMNDMQSLGEPGLIEICNQIIPTGTGDDSRYRYAVENYSRFLSQKGKESERAAWEKICIKHAIAKKDNGVEDFFMKQLQLIGGDASAEAMKPLLTSKEMCQPALAVILSVGGKTSESILAESLKNRDLPCAAAVMNALSLMNSHSAVNEYITWASVIDVNTRASAYNALAMSGSPLAYPVLSKAARDVLYRWEHTGATSALLNYASVIGQNGDIKKMDNICRLVISKCNEDLNIQNKIAALDIYSGFHGIDAMPMLIKAAAHENSKYRISAMRMSLKISGTEVTNMWINYYPKAVLEARPEIITMLGERGDKLALSLVTSSLSDQDQNTRIAASEAIVKISGSESLHSLINYMLVFAADPDQKAVKTAIMNVAGNDKMPLLIPVLNDGPSAAKKSVIEILAWNKDNKYFTDILPFATSTDEKVQSAAFKALTELAGPADQVKLIELLSTTEKPEYITDLQNAIALAANTISDPEKRSETVLLTMNGKINKEKLIPVLAKTGGTKALAVVMKEFEDGNAEMRSVCFRTLTVWRDYSASTALYEICASGNKTYEAPAFDGYVSQISSAEITDEKKLLLYKKIMPFALTSERKNRLLTELSDLKTYQTLFFAADYLDDPSTSATAAKALMYIALPTMTSKAGMYGELVKDILTKAAEKLAGQESEFDRELVNKYIAAMPADEGFKPMFNGKDLSGWQGLVENPLARARMKPADLAKKQAEADKKVAGNWSVKDGCIWFNGSGDNLCSIKEYSDFEMLIDWKITKAGDSGIYLRGTPQIQIWDTSRIDVGAQVGSGGLYNNQKNQAKPLKVSDNAVGEWNSFRIVMIGEKVSVWLNGDLVVDNVTMENYWDRNIPVFPKGAIELQAHGTDLAFRDIFIREISDREYNLTPEERSEGYIALFNGRNLDNWTGNKVSYIVEDAAIVVKPGDSSGGNLYTEKEYADFVFRFEFQLTPAANNGLGIRTPLTGDAAYVGMELQILDDTAPVYANLQPYQYHGSVYGVIPAKKGSLKPVGEWNYEEVRIQGTKITITLNGGVIVDGDIAGPRDNGTLDKIDHPGLKNIKGHIGFLGHGSELKFRNIRIKDLSK